MNVSYEFHLIKLNKAASVVEPHFLSRSTHLLFMCQAQSYKPKLIQMQDEEFQPKNKHKYEQCV